MSTFDKKMMDLLLVLEPEAIEVLLIGDLVTDQKDED